MKLEICDVGGSCGAIVTLTGEVGFSETRELMTLLDQVLQADARGLVLDLADLSFIASDGLGVLIRTQAHAEKLGKPFLLVRPQKRILDLLEKTCLTRVFTIFPNMEDALAELPTGKASLPEA
jgi:anti-sigma B factor antagonist